MFLEHILQITPLTHSLVQSLSSISNYYSDYKHCCGILKTELSPGGSGNSIVSSIATEIGWVIPLWGASSRQCWLFAELREDPSLRLAVCTQKSPEPRRLEDQEEQTLGDGAAAGVVLSGSSSARQANIQLQTAVSVRSSVLSGFSSHFLGLELFCCFILNLCFAFSDPTNGPTSMWKVLVTHFCVVSYSQTSSRSTTGKYLV